MEKIQLNYQHDSSVAQIILNAPKGNVLDSIMMKELTHALLSLKSKNNIKAITFEGAGSNFSFGASVEEHRKESAAGMLKQFHGLFYFIIDLNIPLIAKISGMCLGGGLELALACNFLFADKSAKLGQPEILLGVFAPVASLILPSKIGNAKAEELLITGKTISADEAKAMGLINEIYEDKPALEKAVDEFIKNHLLPKSASSLRYAAGTARTIFNQGIKEKLQALESMYISELMETFDANEGINSFLEKRKPLWQNK